MSTSIAGYAHVTSTPRLFSGEPHIEGLRIRVRDIVLAREEGHSPEEIVRDVFPDLSLAQVYSALAFYEDNREVIEAAQHREDEEVEAFIKNYPHLVQDRRQ